MKPEVNNATPVSPTHQDGRDHVAAARYARGVRRYIFPAFHFARPAGVVAKFIVTEKTLGVITRLIDVGMIYIIVTGGKYAAIKAFVVMTPANIVLSMAIVYLIDRLNSLGWDITGIDEMRKMENTDYKPNQYIKRFIRWMLLRKMTVFLIGSWFYLDPDYVTLLVRDSKKSFWANSFRITIPSVFLAMVVWTFFYWAAYQGFQWAKLIAM